MTLTAIIFAFTLALLLAFALCRIASDGGDW